MVGRRSFLATAALVALAACGSKFGTSKFRTYDGPEVTQILIYKGQRRMYLLNGKTALKSYRVGLGNNPVGKKQFEGDGKTPEGIYYIDRRNPNSTYHLSLGISYPNAEDRAAAAALGKEPGGDIFIHGRARKNRGRGKDWTAGCIAVTDREMEEIYAMVREGTPIVILP